VVSVCLEVGRSCHFQGVTLGKREQDRLSKRLEVDAVLQKRNFNDRMTELEVDSYLEAQSAYQGALKVLKRAELRLKETRSARIQQVDIEEEDDLIGSSLKRDGSDRILDPIEAKAMKHINEARVTIELYLADTLTTLAYCYEAKLSEFLLALKWYNESLVIYTRHVGKDHPTVLHSLQSVGAIYMELKRWKEAERCFVECLALMKRRLPPGSFPKASGDVVAFATPAENKEMAIMLKCLGVVRSELGEYDSAFETISKSIDQMTLVVLQSKAQETHSPPSSALQSPPNDPFICDAQSKLIWSMFCQLSALKSAYTKRRLSMLYSDEKSFDVEGIDVPRLTRLQIERRSIELARQLVKMRRLLLFGEHYEEKIVGTWKKSIRWFDLLDLLSDQLCLGKLLFRRCDYGEAISCWAFALEVMSVTKEGDVPTKMSRAMQRALLECEEKRLDRLSELNYLVGIAHCRVAANDEATAWFEKAIAHLEEKKRILSENGTLNVHNGAEEEKWDILDIDIGVCEHALGLAYYYSNQFSLAAAHFKESLRILEAVASRLRARASIPQGRDDPNMEVMDVALCEYSIRTEFDVCINNVISSVMISLGALYHEQENNARALRFLEGAIKIVYSTTHRVLSSQKISALAIPSVTGFSDISLVLPVIRVGDAHRRIATINLEMENSEEAKLALETAIRCLESTNLESRLSLRIDDETHLESVGQNEVDEMLLSCYELMMTMVDPANPIGEPAQSGTKWWRFLDRRHDRYESFSVNGGLTREDLLFRLGNISAKRGKFDSAIRYLLDARHQMERILGLKDHQMIGNIMFNLGNVYKNIYDAQLKKNDRRAKEKAIESFVESLRIAKSTSGPDSLAAAEVMELLALILMEDESKNPEDWACADDEVARNFLRDAISVRNNCRSDMNLSYARSVHSLGMLALRRQLRCINDGQKHCDDSALDEAVSCLSQAVRIRRILLGDHLDVAASANGLGVAIWLRSISPKAGANASLKDSTKQLQDALFIRTSFLERFCGQNACPLENWKARVFRKELDGTADIGSVVMQTVEAMYDIARVHESHRSYDEQRQWLEKAMKFLEGWLDKVSGDSSSDERSLATLMAPATKVWKSKLYFGLGISWYFSGDISKAIVDFEKSLKLRGLDSTDMLPPDEVFDNFFLREPGKNPAIQAGSAALAVAATMERLAFAYNKMEKLDSSLSCFSFCLQAYAEQFGHESKEVANILYRMGSIYERRQDLKRCVRALQRVLRIKDRAGEVSSLPCVEDALTYFRLARSLMTLGDFDDAALEHFFSAVRLLEEINLSRQANENATKNTTVNLQSEKVDWQADVSTYNINDLLLEGYSSILTLLRRQNVDSLEHEEIINEVIHNIGNTQAAVHQYQRALQSLESVLQFQKSTKGDKHLSVADLLFNLGNIYVELGQIDRARECHLECHAISKSFLGNDSVELAENIICLGNVEFLSANHLFALEWFDEALRLLKKRKGTNEVAIAKCLHRKALAHDKIGDYDKSIECFGDVLRLGRKLWGMNHMELSNILNSVGTVHRNRGEIKRAMKCYEESLRIRSKLHAELCVANTKNNIGALFISMDRPDHARRFYAEALRIKTEILGPENIETSRSLYNVGQLYVAEKDFRTGLRFFQEGTYTTSCFLVVFSSVLIVLLVSLEDLQD
jgi:tetratricopeptide (TPR) repeat protein